MRGLMYSIALRSLLWFAVVGLDTRTKNIDQTVMNAQVDTAHSSNTDGEGHLRGSGVNGEDATKNVDVGTALSGGRDKVFHPRCRKACDSCFAAHAMYCYAQCFKGCQQWCKEVDTLPGCSEREMWTATPGSAPEFTPANRICSSDDQDGCPSAYLFD